MKLYAERLEQQLPLFPDEDSPRPHVLSREGTMLESCLRTPEAVRMALRR